MIDRRDLQVTSYFEIVAFRIQVSDNLNLGFKITAIKGFPDTNKKDDSEFSSPCL